MDGQFTGVGVSEAVKLGPRTPFNVSLVDLDGEVLIQRSFDKGVTWITVRTFTEDYQGAGYEPETGVQWRYNCTQYDSGPIIYRLGAQTA